MKKNNSELWLANRPSLDGDEPLDVGFTTSV